MVAYWVLYATLESDAANTVYLIGCLLVNSPHLILGLG